LLAYGGLCVLIAAFQRSLIYHPFKVTALPAAAAPLPPGSIHDVTFESKVGTLHGWHTLPQGERAETPAEIAERLAAARFVVLYFSGNAAHRGYRSEEMRLMGRAGAHTFLFDYRGYAENPGSPSEAGINEDAHAAWKYLTQERGIPAAKIVLCGESLGGGVATRLAGELCAAGTPPGGLILRSTFSSLVDAAGYHFPWLPVRLVLIDRFRSDHWIQQVTCPILSIHGALDTIVPLRLGQKLFSLAPTESSSGVPKRFVELPRTDHNDVLHTAFGRVEVAVKEFFESIDGATKRE
jgi:fermentation-respiration switch protein FrsA (DUF1100 family)